jgi:glycosyltransferase involved in cell wall biosynthesis
MTRIAFDARMVHHSGIGTYIRGLVEAMTRNCGESGPVQFSFLGDPEVLHRYTCFHEPSQVVRAVMPVYGVREQLMFPRVRGVDAYHFPHYNVPFGLGKPFFVTIHDLIHILYPEFVASRPKRWLGRHVLHRAAKKALAVFTVSERSRRDITEVLGVAPERIVVTPNAVSDSFQPVAPVEVESTRRVMGLPSRFLLAVGVNKPHKNLRFLVEVFGEWKRRARSDVSLVLCGPRRENDGELRRAAERGACADQVCFVSYTEHERMPALYQAAEALVFPSLYEGFGLPVLEAQRVGTPVIASNAASIPEVAGDAALLFDPQEPEELIGRLDELVGDRLVAERLRERGFANERRFRWDASARQTIATYVDRLG